MGNAGKASVMAEQHSPGSEKMHLDRDDEDHLFVDQSKIDFDPDDGLLSGTAIDGTSDIPDPDNGGSDTEGGSESAQ